MNRHIALQVLDEAAGDQLKHIFSELVENLAGGEETDKAVDQFKAGVGLIREAFGHATAVIEEAFP